MAFDRDWNDFLGFMVYNTPGTGLGPGDNDKTWYDEFEEEDEEEEESNLPWWKR